MRVYGGDEDGITLPVSVSRNNKRARQPCRAVLLNQHQESAYEYPGCTDEEGVSLESGGGGYVSVIWTVYAACIACTRIRGTESATTAVNVGRGCGERRDGGRSCCARCRVSGCGRGRVPGRTSDGDDDALGDGGSDGEGGEGGGEGGE
jgi:hypothetical protein